MSALPGPLVGHAQPRLSGRQSRAVLKQLNGDAVGGADKGHAAIPRGPQDGDASVHEALAFGVDIGDGEGEVAKVATTRLRGVLVPIMRQLDLGLAGGGGEKDEGEATALMIFAAGLDQAKGAHVEVEGGLEVVDPDHRVEIFHAAAVDFAGVALALLESDLAELSPELLVDLVEPEALPSDLGVEA